MEILQRFLPRNQATDRWVLFVLTVVSAGLTVVFTITYPPARPFEGALTIALSLVLIALVTCMVAMQQQPPWLWAAYPFMAITLMVVMDVITDDASVTAQVFFFFPVLYAGAQLRRAPAMAVCLACIAGEAIVALTLSTDGKAGMDVAFVSVALATAGGLLIQAGERNDKLIAQLEQQAAVDPLTGLTTRRVLDSAVRSALDGAGDPRGTALLLMDVDRFKAINDEHGHPAGDAVLQQLAGILIETSRRGDLVSRLGGDEIAVLLPGCPLDVAALRADTILQAVRDHAFEITEHSMNGHHHGRVVLNVTLSIGIAHVSTETRELRELYAAADRALYAAKRGGRNRVAVTPPDGQDALEPRGSAGAGDTAPVTSSAG